MFDVNYNTIAAEDPAMSVGVDPVPYDASSVSEVMYRYQPQTGTTTIGGVPCYNGQEVMFNLNISSSQRIDFTKSYILMGGTLRKDNTGTVLASASSDNDHVSLPWNPLAAFVSSADLLFNESSSLAELYMTDPGHGWMVKCLTKYSKEELDNRGDLFFTPTIENTYDMTTSLSKESKDRSASWFAADTAHSADKQIPLGDMFSACDIPAAMYLNTLRIRMRLKNPTDIPFTDDSATYTDPSFFINRCELYLCLMTLSPAQLTAERKKIKENKVLTRQGYTIYDVSSKPFSSNASYRDAAIKNLQANVVLFSANGRKVDGTKTGVNPYQYCYGQDNGIGITSIQSQYNGQYSPATPMDIRPETSRNVQMYQQYLLLCRKTLNREDTPALKFENMVDPSSTTAITALTCPYVMFCMPFYSMTAYASLHLSGSDLEVAVQGGTTSGNVIVVRIRTSLLEIRPSSSVYVLN